MRIKKTIALKIESVVTYKIKGVGKTILSVSEKQK
jgi:hypothetical protein